MVFDAPHDYMFQDRSGLISIRIPDIEASVVEHVSDNDYFVDVGSPHHIKFIPNVKNYDVLSEEQALPSSDRYSQPDQNGLTGVNISFLEQLDASTCQIRTYEMSVERETQACAPGCIASSLASITMSMQNSSEEKTHHL